MRADTALNPIHDLQDINESESSLLLRSTLSYLPSRHHSDTLLVITSRLLIWMTYLKNLASPPSISSLRNMLFSEIQKFEQCAQRSGYDTQTILAIRYCLCTSLDEAILSTSWGIKSAWADQTLLSFFHKETCGGEKFYFILDVFAEEPLKNVAGLKLIFILLALGFKGRFYDQGEVVSQAILLQLFHKIQPFLKSPSSFLLKTNQAERKMKKNISVWLLFILLLASLLISESFYESSIYKMESHFLNSIKEIRTKKISKYEL